ncbi:MAG: NAD-dependent epimerase [Candidatus Aminicenantes bacterium]|nr:NAD-dependent epimerase [Candidatus Aminicenantes bacterium]
MKILITGTAGFIGYHLVKKLTGKDLEIVGIDNINDYYDVNLKYARLKETGILKERIEEGRVVKSEIFPDYSFVKMDLKDTDGVNDIFNKNKFDLVCHLAAQAGVRYSIENPKAYIESNLNAFANILEGVRNFKTGHLVYASSSSVYGLNETMPFSTHHNVDHPVSLYAATKKGNELLAHSYSYLYGIPVTGLRFFTVYGPWGRPDMALFRFVKNILEGKPIEVYNFGKMERDFTYIDDIVLGIEKVLSIRPKGNPDWNGMQPDPSSSTSPYKIYNIGNGKPVKLMDFISVMEKTLGMEGEKKMMPIQPGDVVKTWADTRDFENDTGYRPTTPVETGVRNFIDWYRDFYVHQKDN